MSNLIRIVLEDPNQDLVDYDQIQVWRSDAEGGTYAEVTAAARVDLDAEEVVYRYEHKTGRPGDWYKWRLYNSATAAVSAFYEETQGIGLYASTADLRAEGVPVTISDARILDTLERVQEMIDRLARQWFSPRDLTLELDGTGTTLLQLQVVPISISALYLNGSEEAADVGSYEVYSARKNPRVKLVTTESESIFVGTGSVAGLTVFDVGEKNQTLVGTWGCVEADGTTPAPIRYATRKLCVRSLKPLWTSGGAAGSAGPVIEEETDRHRKRWADPLSTSGAWSSTGDVEVDQILAMYRAPLAIRAPRTAFHRFGTR